MEAVSRLPAIFEGRGVVYPGLAGYVSHVELARVRDLPHCVQLA